ncbi:MAG: protein kinase domain-containing protein [Cuspidothrix sp.]
MNWNGRFIGDNQRYRIDKSLAVGGMGEVLLATDTRVGQQVVLKLLKDTLVASQEMRKRFEREVSVCAALQSDHIVKISDCGVTPEGYPFYVMEYLRGQTLRELLLRERRLSVERTISIISQVCQALQMAHQGVTIQKDGSSEHIQVIHRDLKPDNIFLIPTDLGEWVKILDFGVAKIRNDSSEQSSLTTTFIGTFRYAAPEQIQNKQNLDARADIYSLGIILYEMLSAADPFGFSIKGNNISEASWVVAHTYELPTPLREKPGCENISAEMETVVIKCLQKDPNNRFATVGELNQALQEAIKPTLGTTNTINKTIVQPGLDSHQETVSKPLQSLVPNQSDNETILPHPQLPNQESNNDTVSRPPQPIQTSPTVENQQSNNETIAGAIQPIQGQPPQENTYQHRPSPYLKPDQETVSKPVQPPQATEGTILQPHPSSQPKPSPSPADWQINNEQANNLDDTLYQPRLGKTTTPNNTPDNTIFQLKPEKLGGSSHSFGRNMWIGLGIVLVCLTGVLIFFLFSHSGSQNSPSQPNSNQSN